MSSQGGTLKFLYKRRLGLFFGGFKILNFNIFGGFKKSLGNEYFVDIFFFGGGGGGVTTKLAYINGSFPCILGSFLKGKVQNGGYFGRLLKFQTLFCVLEIPDIF